MRVKIEVKSEAKDLVAIGQKNFKTEIATETKSSASKKVKRRIKSEDGGASPFPDFNRPCYEDCREVVESLSALHGVKEAQNSIRPVLDALIRTILSQNTTDKTSMIAFQNLKRVCPTWKSCLAAENSIVEEAIRFGGLAEIKTKRIKVILRDILDRHSAHCIDQEPSLEWMRALSTADIKAELGAYNGVGPKTVSCVLMFAMERAEFPVDTHVWHITKKLGWVPVSCSRESCYEHLNSRVPDEFKFALHVLLVDHGKVCKACSKGGGGGGGKSGKRGVEGGSQCCPLRRVGSLPASFEEPGTDLKSLFSSCQDKAESIEKIKREYHIKEELQHETEYNKDRAIKAEPGHHDKISMGLFPSDVNSSYTSIKVEEEVMVKVEIAAAIIKVEEANGELKIKAEGAGIKREKTTISERIGGMTPSVTPRRSRRRSLSTVQEDKVDSKSGGDDEIFLVKRRGAILC